jgi:hypothetical protein
MIDDDECGAVGGMKIGRGNRGKKPYPSAIVSTTNSTLLDMVSNPGRRDGKPANNRLSYGAVLLLWVNTASLNKLQGFLDYLRKYNFLKRDTGHRYKYGLK